MCVCMCVCVRICVCVRMRVCVCVYGTCVQSPVGPQLLPVGGVHLQAAAATHLLGMPAKVAAHAAFPHTVL